MNKWLSTFIVCLATLVVTSQDTLMHGDTLIVADTTYNEDSSKIEVRVRKKVIDPSTEKKEENEGTATSSMKNDCPPEMAEGLRSSGKIYVVVAVLAVIFAGIVIFLVYLDRKLRRLEKQTEE